MCAIHEHGYVILENAVAAEPLAALRERMDRDTEELLAYCESIGGNPRERGHLQQGPPLSADFVFAEVAMNRFVNRVCSELYEHRPSADVLQRQHELSWQHDTALAHGRATYGA